MKPACSVAHLTPYSITFPLDHHNGRYDWVIDLATRQAAAGLAVTIYSNPASYIDIPGVSWKSIEGSYDDTATANRTLLLEALRDQSVDIYHSHYDNLHYTVSDATAKPIVFTQHWWPTEETIASAKSHPSPNVWAVPPTHFMLDFDKQHGIRTKGCIYHGIDLTAFRPARNARSDRLLFVGRIAPEKNLPVAIEAAKRAGLPLDIIGKVAPKNRSYWDGLQASIDGEQIRYLGPKSPRELIGHYGSARAVIFPSDIHEPFGLVAIESQACGTPVLMQRGGSRAELVIDGKTGYLCDTADEFAAAALKSKDISAEDCVSFAKRFDVNRMAAEYLELYEQLLA
ncbi:MAG: glycosyltransferase [Candidatus Saccharibacteria bacterium]